MERSPSNPIQNLNLRPIKKRRSDIRLLTLSITPPLTRPSYDTSNSLFDVQIEGELAILSEWGDGIKILNISDPTNPRLVGYYDTSGLAFETCVKGNYIYVADRDAGLKILKIGEIDTTPDIIGTYDSDNNVVWARIEGGIAYLRC